MRLIVLVAALGLIGCAAAQTGNGAYPSNINSASGPLVGEIDSLPFEERVEMQKEIIRQQERRIEMLEQELQILERQKFQDQLLEPYEVP